MGPIVLNIPHASTVIPPWALKDIVISKDGLSFWADFMADKDIDKLWDFVPEQNKQVAVISRLITDTERYRNDADEAMASRGMGLYYTHTPDGRQFRLKNEESYLKCLDIYDEYHRCFEEKVARRLDTYGRCLILDCHSFHDGMDYTGHDPRSFPDVCIGVNGDGPVEAKRIIDLFRAKGYSVKVNEPFAGSLVPLRFIQDRRVSSFMIELNRRIYDNASFDAVKNICEEIYKQLRR